MGVGSAVEWGRGRRAKGTGSRSRWDEPPHRFLACLVYVCAILGADGSEPSAASPESVPPRCTHLPLLDNEHPACGRLLTCGCNNSPPNLSQKPHRLAILLDRFVMGGYAL